MRFAAFTLFSHVRSTGRINKGLASYSLVNPEKLNVKVDCEVTDWKRTPCNSTCGEGYRWKSRAIIVSCHDTCWNWIILHVAIFWTNWQKYPQNGGQQCPKRLTRLERCYVNCPKAVALTSSSETSEHSSPPCVYSEWSGWSPCSKTCGDSAVQIRTRTVINHLDVSECSERLEKRQCEIMPCLVENGYGIYYNYHW